MATQALSVTTPGRSGTPGLVGTISALIAGGMLTAGVCSAFIATHTDTVGGTAEFVPKAFTFNNYAAVMTTITMALASLGVGWATTSMKVQNRRWASSGFGVAAFLDIAALNMLWFIAEGAKLPIKGGTFAPLFYTLLALGAAVIFIGLLSSLMGVARVLGGQASVAQPHYAFHATWGQHFAGAAWFAIFATIFWLK
jgi:heme/copper-type cytochrome/quinol oxidase subunit 3